MVRLSEIVGTMASAYILTGDEKYAQHAVKHIKAWFVDEDTKMNPNLLYGQAIKGRFTGRSTGVIDTIHLVEVARSVMLLKNSPSFPAKDYASRESLVPGLSDLAHDAPLRLGRTRCNEQPRHLLVDASRRIRVVGRR